MTRAEYERATARELILDAGKRVPRQLLVFVAAALAESGLYIFEEAHPGDDRPRRAIETARAWCRGEATWEEVRDAAAYVTGAIATANAAGHYAAAHAASAATATHAAAHADAHADTHATVAAANAAVYYVTYAASAASAATHAAWITRGASTVNAALTRQLLPFTTKAHSAWSWEGEVSIPSGEGAVRAGDYILLLKDRSPILTLLPSKARYAWLHPEWQVLVDMSLSS